MNANLFNSLTYFLSVLYFKKKFRIALEKYKKSLIPKINSILDIHSIEARGLKDANLDGNSDLYM
jgi:hypothetical protein